MTEKQHETARRRSGLERHRHFPAGLLSLALLLPLFGCKWLYDEPPGAPVEEPSGPPPQESDATSTAGALHTWPAEATEPTGTWVCPPRARADEPGFKVGDPSYKGERYEVLWIHDDAGFRSRSLQDQGGTWKWQKGDYDEEISWFAHSFPGVRSVHHYVCTRVPGDNHWCKLLLSPSQGENGYSLELLDLLEPAHKHKSYDSAERAENVLEGALKSTCRYQRIANRPLSEDEVLELVGLLQQASLEESETD